MNTLSICLIFLAGTVFATAQYYGQPEQIHLSYTGNVSTMYVTWLTFDATSHSVVEYGINGSLSMSKDGSQTSFKEGIATRTAYVHRVKIDRLTPGITYLYRVGSPEAGWSSIHFFKALTPESKNGTTYAIYGDLGNVNGRSIPRLQKGAQNGEFDMVLHVGDFAYDMWKSQGRVGDQFMRQIEPIASYVPYMTVPGNHENFRNFTHYVNRFTMPGETNFFYSFDLGPVHIIGLTTEFYFYPRLGWHQVANQYYWLIKDLEKANENREKVPWIILMGHRPMYCSTFDADDCQRLESVIRCGFKTGTAYALEVLLYKYGVDVAIWAHEHNYERMYPVYNRTVYNESADPYLNPPAPVHMTIGSAGCQENTDHFKPHPPPWSAVRSSDYGYTLMKVFNHTHLHFQEISDTQGGKVIDSFWLRKDQHKPYSLPKKDVKGHYIDYNYRPAFSQRQNVKSK